MLRLVGEGLPNSEISERIHLSEGTVRNYLSSAIVKLGARNRTEVFAFARTRDICDIRHRRHRLIPHLSGG